MDISYEQIQNDLTEVRSLGCGETTFVRLKMVCDHAFDVERKISALENLLERSKVTEARLKEILFGKTAPQPDDDKKQEETEETNTEQEVTADVKTVDSTNTTDQTDDQDNKKNQGSGNGCLPASAYTGAEHHVCENTQFKAGDICPACEKSRLYNLPSLNKIVIKASSLFQADHYEVKRLVCVCGFKVVAPRGGLI